MSQKKRVIVWFRQDLRIHDNEALHNALSAGDEVIPVYIFDERMFVGETHAYGFPKTGRYRARFILESVRDLRRRLRERGSDLVVRVGKPEEEIFGIARRSRSSWVFCNRERTRDEVAVQDQLERNLWSIGQEIIYSRGKMLYYTQDLPFPVTHTPDNYSLFRKEVERIVAVRSPLPTPDDLKPFTVEIDPGEMPSEADLGIPDFERDARAELTYRGGETAALQRLQKFLWETEAVADYCQNRSNLQGQMKSSHFSPWLAQGCLSPKMVYGELKKYEAERGGRNQSTYAIFYELMYRDFLRLMGKKHGDKIFLRGGMKEEPLEGLKDEEALLNLWVEGRTGVPFIDANMRQLALTGYISHQGRTNVANFLVKDLKVNWQMGAEYFESVLIDYDPCSNWVNWNFLVGLGCDGRDDKYLNILSQARKYDPDGTYVKRWLPELAEVPADKVHRPDILSTEEQQAHRVRLGDDYPRAMISTSRWV